MHVCYYHSLLTEVVGLWSLHTIYLYDIPLHHILHIIYYCILYNIRKLYSPGVELQLSIIAGSKLYTIALLNNLLEAGQASEMFY